MRGSKHILSCQHEFDGFMNTLNIVFTVLKGSLESTIILTRSLTRSDTNFGPHVTSYSNYKK